jgi:hypothetical protein
MLVTVVVKVTAVVAVAAASVTVTVTRAPVNGGKPPVVVVVAGAVLDGVVWVRADAAVVVLTSVVVEGVRNTVEDVCGG